MLDAAAKTHSLPCKVYELYLWRQSSYTPTTPFMLPTCLQHCTHAQQGCRVDQPASIPLLFWRWFPARG